MERIKLSLMITKNINSNYKDYVRNKMIEFNLMHFPDDLKGRYQELNLQLVNEDGLIFGGIVGGVLLELVGDTILIC